MSTAHELIDTPEMYLRTVIELEEENIAPLRSRIAARLSQSVPTVSETITRMERDGLLTVGDRRHIKLTRTGRAKATRIMRKHRLAECLLVELIGLDWHLVHDEACRWEHVMSETVERRLLEILHHPTESPFGNPIPGLAELDDPPAADPPPGMVALNDLPADVDAVVVHRVSESFQSDTALLTRLRRAGFRPNATVAITRRDGQVVVGRGQHAVELDPAVAAHIYVSEAP